MRESEAGMDPLTAHLDRGWTLVADREFRGARVSAEQVLDLDPENPEGLTLLGMAEMGAGDPDAALDAFDAARDQDPDYLAPVLYGAEVLANDPERTEEALARLEDAYGLAEPRSPEHTDIALLHLDLLLSRGQDREARRRLLTLDPERIVEPDQRVQAGKMAVELEAMDFAEQVLAPLADRRDIPADALYALARIAEHDDDFAGALDLLLRVRVADAQELARRPLLPEAELEDLCRAAIRHLPKSLQSIVADAGIRIRDLPAEELVADGLDPRLPLLVTGPPLPPEVADLPRAFHIFLYRGNLTFGGTQRRDHQIAELVETLTLSLERFGD